MQFSGIFKKGPDGYYFEPKKSYIGGLPLPEELAQPLVDAFLHKVFGDPQAGGLVKAWPQIQAISLDKSVLRLSWSYAQH